MNLGSKVLAYEINAIIQNAADEGRKQLNDEEAIHLLRISEKLISEYVKELENEDLNAGAGAGMNEKQGVVSIDGW